MKKVIYLVLIIVFTISGCSKVNNSYKDSNKLVLSYDLEIDGLPNREHSKSIRALIEWYLEEDYSDFYVHVNEDKVIIEVYDILESNIQDVTSTIINMNGKLCFRDSNDTLLATSDDLIKNITLGEKNYYGVDTINLHIKNVDLFKDITAYISSTDEYRLYIWQGFQNGIDTRELVETDVSVARKLVYSAKIMETIESDILSITGAYTETDNSKLIDRLRASLINFELSNQSYKYYDR